MIPPAEHPLILGAAYGYRVSQLAPFLASARRYVPRAAVVLLRDRPDPAFLAEARLLNPNVDVYLPRNRQLSRFWYCVPARGLLAAMLTPWLTRIWQRLPSLRGPIERFSSAMMHVASLRFFAAADYLDTASDIYDTVLFSDTRDVLFQGDLFRHGVSGFVATDEPSAIRNCVFNTWWFCRLYSWSDYATIRNFPILCSGVSVGERAAMRDYLSKIVAELMRSLTITAFQFGYDQAAHNKVLQLDRSIGFRIGNSASCSVVNLTHVNLDDYRLGDDGVLYNVDGIPFDILHQYDRHAKLVEAVNKKYSRSNESKSMMDCGRVADSCPHQDA